MNDLELDALRVLVARETAHFDVLSKQYGEAPFDPNTPASRALENELVRRNIVKL